MVCVAGVYRYPGSLRSCAAAARRLVTVACLVSNSAQPTPPCMISHLQLSAHFEHAAVCLPRRQTHGTCELSTRPATEAQPSSCQWPAHADLRSTKRRRLVCEAAPVIAEDVKPVLSDSLSTPSSTQQQVLARLRQSTVLALGFCFACLQVVWLPAKEPQRVTYP